MSEYGMTNYEYDGTKKINRGIAEQYGYVGGTNIVVCPHCGDERDFIYDDQENAPYENCEVQCAECEEYFYLSCEIEYTFEFSSSKEEMK